MARFREASDGDKRRMAKEAKRTGKKLAEERGKCIACVRYRDGAKYVDLGGELPWVGQLYICSSCIDRCRRVLGYASQREFEAQEKDLVEKTEQIQSLQTEVAALEEQLRAATNEIFSEVLLRARDIEQTG
jgi:flagellar motility protein MotE (MotC chaperone)